MKNYLVKIGDSKFRVKANDKFEALRKAKRVKFADDSVKLRVLAEKSYKEMDYILNHKNSNETEKRVKELENSMMALLQELRRARYKLYNAAENGKYDPKDRIVVILTRLALGLKYDIYKVVHVDGAFKNLSSDIYLEVQEYFEVLRNKDR